MHPVSSAYPPEFFHAWENLTVKIPSLPSDFSGAVIYQQPIHIMQQLGCLQPVISFGL